MTSAVLIRVLEEWVGGYAMDCSLVVDSDSIELVQEMNEGFQLGGVSMGGINITIVTIVRFGVFLLPSSLHPMFIFCLIKISQ